MLPILYHMYDDGITSGFDTNFDHMSFCPPLCLFVCFFLSLCLCVIF